MRVVGLTLLMIVGLLGTTCAQKPEFSQKEQEALVYDFVNDVMKKVGLYHPNKLVYLEEIVRGNKCYDSKPDRIFLDRIRKMNTELLDSILTEDDLWFMKHQAENLVFKRWKQKRLTLKHVKVLPSASSRKESNPAQGSQFIGISPPFFSQDKQKAIFFMCRQGMDDGWDAVALYMRSKDGWELMTTKLTLWHVKQ